MTAVRKNLGILRQNSVTLHIFSTKRGNLANSRQLSYQTPNQKSDPPYIRWHLYRSLLRGMQSFPSVNREKLYVSIQEEFREPVLATKRLDAEAEQSRRLELAEKSIEQLAMYNTQTTGEKAESPDWSVTMQENPMPKREKK
mmetsp:Transcript_35972/g.83975  ORF Transcript_35972/g.83975 Transcript_35972/m.83975 type:complete len:142 (-) Transcript_35972:73-498(-)